MDVKTKREKNLLRDSFSLIKTERLTTDNNGNFVQPSTGRVVTLHGINIASCSKLPDIPYQTSYLNPNECGFYSDADFVSFVNRPFPLEDAYEHLTRIKLCGYNTIRFIFTWEAIEHEGPGVYDVDYIQYVIDLLKIIDEVGGLYVFLDPHQDVWSKFCGGSGAPIWTLYAAGLEPKNFEVTGASKLHSMCSDPSKFTKMVWSTNYDKLACQIMFTMFFSGKMFMPNAIIDGANIQDYLQNHFIDSVAFLLSSIKKKAPSLFETCLIGVESLNEPSKGLYGLQDMSKISEDQNLRLDETPTVIQSLNLSMGHKQTVDKYSLTSFGPKKVGSITIDPRGVKSWVSNDKMDIHYGFNRDKKWKLGDCLLSQLGVWNSKTGELNHPDFFSKNPTTGEPINESTFINIQYLSFWMKFKRKLRTIDENIFLIMQAPVLQIPPHIRKTKYVDDKTVVAIHYYDGMTLLFKSWNRFMNVDTLGIMRGKYISPMFAIVLGERNIRKSIRNQLREMKRECQENVGMKAPVILTETGMPFDMDDKKAYGDGDYSSQEAATDAINFAIEGSSLNFTYWCYNPENCHKWGDRWNLEDFSVFSKDDMVAKNLDFTFGETSGTSSSGRISSYSEWITTGGSESTYKPNEHITFTGGTINSNSNSIGKHSEVNNSEVELMSSVFEPRNTLGRLLEGVRVPSAIIRPYAVLVNGSVIDASTDIKAHTYSLEVDSARLTPAPSLEPTVVFLPEKHFPPGKFEVSVDTGITKCKHDGIYQTLEWYYDENVGKVHLQVKNTSTSKSAESRGKFRMFLHLLTCGLL